ncbi:hypothetical protein R1sor_002549 [Riccia sorocarpa]|uniref:G protein gamma domain-containing protein n=1 Tax=Riccia sorocarpa TaxID=122646 RepID=A0ABD3GZ48_9MARC
METARRYSPNGASTSRTASPPYSNSPRASRPLPQPRSVPDLHGRARKKAELNRLTQEIQLLEEEMQRLETLPPASEVCQELVQSIESRSDPFVGTNPVEAQWDRWFRGIFAGLVGVVT